MNLVVWQSSQWNGAFVRTTLEQTRKKKLFVSQHLSQTIFKNQSEFVVVKVNDQKVIEIVFKFQIRKFQ